MDALSPEETKEVERNLAQYPELNKELELIREGLTLFATTYAQKPKEHLKSKVLSALPFASSEVNQSENGSATKSVEEAKVIQIKPRINVWLAAASIALLISTSWLLFRNSQYSDRISELETRIADSERKFADLNARFTANTKYLTDVTSPDTRKILLSSKTSDPGANAVVFLNTKDASVLISIDQLAEIPEENQYQLWALVDGKPIDMGVLDSKGVQKAKNIPELLNAQAFAITIEKKGGSPLPTLEKMVAAGAAS